MKTKERTDGWKSFEGKRVYIQIDTINGQRVYSGSVVEVTYLGKNTENVETYFLLLNDKFGNKVGVVSSQIKLIEEEK
ncbi:MAG: hypothetical protein ACOC56_02330 [Atribacterota bacterium]